MFNTEQRAKLETMILEGWYIQPESYKNVTLYDILLDEKEGIRRVYGYVSKNTAEAANVLGMAMRPEKLCRATNFDPTTLLPPDGMLIR